MVPVMCGQGSIIHKSNISDFISLVLFSYSVISTVVMFKYLCDFALILANLHLMELLYMYIMSTGIYPYLHYLNVCNICMCPFSEICTW